MNCGLLTPITFVLVSIIIVYCKSEQIKTEASNDDRLIKESHTLQCFDTLTRRHYYVGDSFYRIEKCSRVQCLSDLTLWEDECQERNYDGNCIRKGSDPNQGYPRCCPSYECRKTVDDGRIEETQIYDYYGNIMSSSVTKTFNVSTNRFDSANQPYYVTVRKT